MAVLSQSPVDYVDMDYIPGETILPGVCDVIYFISRGDIVKWPTRDVSKAKGRSTYQGDFQLAEGKKWRILRATYDGAEWSYEDQGVKPGKTTLNKLPVPYPKHSAEACDNATAMQNDNVVCIFKDRQGNYRVMGADEMPGDVKVSGGSGKGIAGEGGMKLEISATDFGPCPIYTGKIDTEAGMVNAPEAA